MIEPDTLEEICKRTLRFERRATQTFGRVPDGTKIGTGFELAIFHLTKHTDSMNDTRPETPGDEIRGPGTVRCCRWTSDGEWDVRSAPLEAR